MGFCGVNRIPLAQFGRGKPLSAVSAETLKTLAVFYNEIEILGGRIIRDPSGKITIVPPGYEQDETRATYAFSFQVLPDSSDATKVLVMGGACNYAGTPTGINSSSVTCSSSGVIYMKLEYATGAWTGPAFASSVTDDDDTQHIILADVVMSSGAVTAILQRHLGDIYETRT